MTCGRKVVKNFKTLVDGKVELHAPCGLDKGHKGKCSVRAYGERIAAHTAPGLIDQDNAAPLNQSV